MIENERLSAKEPAQLVEEIRTIDVLPYRCDQHCSCIYEREEN